MPRDWESQFRRWADPPSATETDKLERALRMVQAAINDHTWFAGHRPRVYAKGSYANNTNARLESDVDIAVEFSQSIYFTGESVLGFTPAAVGLTTPATISYPTFKDKVGDALSAWFGAAAIVRGNKAYDVHENSSRVDADVVPCWEYRSYYGLGPRDYILGTKLVADDGTQVINWPEQQLANGNAKNVRTGRRYKFITRAIKNLRYEMEDAGYEAAERIPSYLIECLAYNIPDAVFTEPTTYHEIVDLCLAIFARGNTSAWQEVNELKPLYGAGQTWTEQQVVDFGEAGFAYVRSM